MMGVGAQGRWSAGAQKEKVEGSGQKAVEKKEEPKPSVKREEVKPEGGITREPESAKEEPKAESKSPSLQVPAKRGKEIMRINAQISKLRKALKL